MSTETAVLIAIGIALIFMAAGFGVFSGSIDIAEDVLGNYSSDIDTNSDKIPTNNEGKNGILYNEKEMRDNWQVRT